LRKSLRKAFQPIPKNNVGWLIKNDENWPVYNSAMVWYGRSGRKWRLLEKTVLISDRFAHTSANYQVTGQKPSDLAGH